MDIKQMRIHALRELMGPMSQKEFAERHNLDASYLSQLLNGHRSLGEKAAATLETKIGLMAGALVTPVIGKAVALALSQPREIESNAIMLGPIDVWDDDTPLDDDEVYVPFLKEVELSAGGGRNMVQVSPKQKLRFGKITLRRQGVQPSEAVCVTVSGNSMEPVLPDGSTVGVDTGTTAITDGKMYAVDHGGQPPGQDAIPASRWWYPHAQLQSRRAPGRGIHRPGDAGEGNHRSRSGVLVFSALVGDRVIWRGGDL